MGGRVIFGEGLFGLPSAGVPIVELPGDSSRLPPVTMLSARSAEDL